MGPVNRYCYLLGEKEKEKEKKRVSQVEGEECA